MSDDLKRRFPMLDVPHPWSVEVDQLKVEIARLTADLTAARAEIARLQDPVRVQARSKGISQRPDFHATED